MVLIAPDAAAEQTGLEDLLAVLNEAADRLTVAVVLTDADPMPAVTRWNVQVDPDGVLRIPALGLELIAEQLPQSEAAQMAQLIAATSAEQDQPMPPADGDQPWDAFADTAGNLRPELTTAAGQPTLRVAGTWPVRENSILPLPPQQYAAQAATTEEDEALLAPGVTAQVQAELVDADPSLDADVAAWLDPDSARVKLRLLGPLDVWGSGLDPKPAGRPQKVEAVAYLATRVRGASAARCREDLWPEDRDDRPTSKVRNLMLGTRNWLGVNPATGREHIPPNPGEGRGGRLYAVEGILIHADLFRRLRLRALARGVDGVADLRAALNLVTGSPFEGRHPAGYGWVGNTGLDYHYTGMIADAAHIVATHHLAADEPEAAAAAARVALTAPILLCAMQCRDVPADPLRRMPGMDGAVMTCFPPPRTLRPRLSWPTGRVATRRTPKVGSALRRSLRG